MSGLGHASVQDKFVCSPCFVEFSIARTVFIACPVVLIATFSLSLLEYEPTYGTRSLLKLGHLFVAFWVPGSAIHDA